MQRDEGTLLLAWLTHYGLLFGVEHLTILDNGSTDPLTVHILRHAEFLGATVRRDLCSVEDFHAKGQHFAEVMRGWARDGEYDFALPVDCDEFLCIVTDDGFSVAKDHIMAEFTTLRTVRAALRIGISLFNVPARPGWFSVDAEFFKGFVPAGGVDLVDNGQHNPNSSLAPGYVMSRFAYLHWHNRPFAEMRSYSRRKLASSLIDPDDPKLAEHYARVPNLPGRHLLPLLKMEEADYLNRYEHDLRVFLPWARSAAGDMGGAEDAQAWLLEDAHGQYRWDAARYRQVNADITTYPLGPLHHFLCHGWREKRSL